MMSDDEAKSLLLSIGTKLDTMINELEHICIGINGPLDDVDGDTT